MAKKILTQVIVLLTASTIFITFNASSNGRGSEDRTGAPGSSGNCSSCHGGGNLNGQLSLELIDKGSSTVVTEYIPGNQYIVSIKASGTSTKMGFQSTVLNASNQNMGSISNPSPGAAVYTSGRNIAGHTSGSSTGIWSFEWTAPSSDQGAATIYGVSVISNKNNSDNGDQVVTQKITINAAASNSLNTTENVGLTIYPNPTRDIVHFSKNIEQVAIFDLSGKLILTEDINSNSLILPTLQSGMYIVRMKTGNNLFYQRILLKK